MILCSFSRKSFFSCFSGNGNGNGRESGLLFGNKWELEYSPRFPKAGNGNGNDVIGMGIHESHSQFPAHLYFSVWAAYSLLTFCKSSLWHFISEISSQHVTPTRQCVMHHLRSVCSFFTIFPTSQTAMDIKISDDDKGDDEDDDVGAALLYASLCMVADSIIDIPPIVWPARSFPLVLSPIVDDSN